MATFKAVVQRHQERRDGKFPVSIRLTHNRRSVYIQTGLYCSIKQINKKSFEIKDSFIMQRTNITIAEFEKKLLSLSLYELQNISANSIKDILVSSTKSLDFLEFCESRIKQDPKKWSRLISVMRIIKDEMGYEKLPVTSLTSAFIRSFKSFMDTRDMLVKQKDGAIVKRGKMSVSSKSAYIDVLHSAFNRMKEAYNTEFNVVIAHDPFIGIENYKRVSTKKKAMSVETLRAFFDLKPRTPLCVMAQDIMKMSFCMCGINVADLFVLTQDNLVDGRIEYKRMKTKGRRADEAYSSIRIEPEIASLVEKYRTNGERLFKFGDYSNNVGLDNSLYNAIVILCKDMGLDYKLSPYWFRHTWATIARNECDISKDDIDLCLNHVGVNKMADVYIKPDWSRIDRANRKVLDFVFGKDNV